MPGLLGFVAKEGKGERNNKMLLKKMFKKMKYFDWFTEELYYDKYAGLGRVGLGIKYGKRVFIKEDKPVFFMDGEIYSFGRFEEIHKETRDLPSLLLTLYLNEGQKFIKEANGAFIIAIWDKEKRRLVILNDRYGLRPLYYTNCNGYFIYSSEIKGMLDFPDFNKKINDKAILEFFSFGYQLGDETFFENVSVLSPGSILTYDKGGIKITKYWDFVFQEEYNKPVKENKYIEELYHLLKSAVDRRCKVDNLRLGSFLSGGLDTRTILALSLTRNIHTFTHETGQPYDVKIAEVVAKRKRVPHHYLPLERDYISRYAKELVWVNEGASDATCGHLFSILDKIKSYVDVILDGTSGDMIMGSFVKKEFFKQRPEAMYNFIYSLINYPFNDSELKLLFRDEYCKKFDYKPYESFHNAFDKIPFQHFANKYDYFILQNKLRRWLFSGLVNIRSRIEVRSPFYDNDLIDFILTIPPKLRLNQYLYKRFLIYHFPSLSRIPQGNGLPIKLGIMQKPFSRFLKKGKKRIKAAKVDFAELIRDESRRFIENLLLAKRTLKRGYFNEEFIRRIVDEHMRGEKNHTTKLSHLVTFELWNRVFIDGAEL